MKKEHYQDIPRVDFYDLECNLYCLILSSGEQVFYIYQSGYPNAKFGLSCGNMSEKEANEYYNSNYRSIIFSLKLNNDFYDYHYPLFNKKQISGNNEFVVRNFVSLFKKCHMNVEKCISTIKERMRPKKVRVVDNVEIYYL